jgi:hypothetical protein
MKIGTNLTQKKIDALIGVEFVLIGVHDYAPTNDM